MGEMMSSISDPDFFVVALLAVGAAAVLVLDIWLAVNAVLWVLRK